MTLNIKDHDDALFDAFNKLVDKACAREAQAPRIYSGNPPLGHYVGGVWVEHIDPEKEAIQRLIDKQKPYEEEFE